MTEYNLLKEKNYNLLKENNLFDEEEIGCVTKVQIKSNQGNMIIPISYVVSVKDNIINLIQAPMSGFFIESPKINIKTIENRIEFDDKNIISASYKKVLGGYKLHFLVAPFKDRTDKNEQGELIEDALFTGEIIFDVTKKLEKIFEKIISKLNIKIIENK